MLFNIISKKFSLEELANEEININFPEGLRKGIIQRTNDPLYRHIFNFTQMGIKKTLYLKKTDVGISKKGIRYLKDYYVLENHF
jgi:hypothetical protein